MLFGEALGELEVLGAARAGGVGEAGAEGAKVLLIELVARAQAVRDLGRDRR
jgi:hypothetical protein